VQTRGTRFESDANSQAYVKTRGRASIDPEEPDATEEQFDVSLSSRELKSARGRFVVDTGEIEGTVPAELSASETNVVTGESSVDSRRMEGVEQAAPAALLKSAPIHSPELLAGANVNISPAAAAQSDHSGSSSSADTFWKDEVAARLNYYRARRKPRPPKYPSLRLKFDAGERRASEVILDTSAHPAASRESVALETGPADGNFEPEMTNSAAEESHAVNPPSETGRVIEFPRSHYDFIYSAPVSTNELADPVFETPRIVEVPEVETPAPALGGITLEPEEREPERRPGFEIPLQSAPMSRRLMATLCDGALVLGAGLSFGYIFSKITGTLPLGKQMATIGIVLLALLWAVYQWLLLTYAGTTPGLRLARLDLRRFDGTPVHRRMRRWRALASILSGVSLGLGYAWCFLDEDALCWHDRITGTHLEVVQSQFEN
jgi:uncharacterized RDD family membrane protein YckC